MSSPRASHEGNSRHSVIVPYRIGLLLDRQDQAHLDLRDALLLGLEEGRRSGALDREVQVVVRTPRGAPEGSVLDVQADWDTLVADRTLMAMVGPFGDDDGAAALPSMRQAGIPVLTCSAGDDFTGPEVFQLPIGHPADVAHRLLRHAAAGGAQRVAVVSEPGPRGRQIQEAFRIAAWQARLARVEGFELDDELAANLRRHAPDAVAYVGGSRHATVDASLCAAGLSLPRITGTEIGRAHSAWGGAEALEGWIGLDMVDAANRNFQRFVQSFADTHGRQADHALAAVGYDMGCLLARALATVRPPSPAGVRAGLDRLRMLPCATGAAGTVISFARYDRRGFKGDPLVLKTVRHGKLESLAEPAAT